MPDQINFATKVKNTKRYGAQHIGNLPNSEGFSGASPCSRVKEPSSPPYVARVGLKSGSRARVTAALSVEQARLIQKAVWHADRIGLPFNRMITIDWALGGINDAQEGRKRLLNLVYDWMRTKGNATAYVWVMENGPKFGVHSHVLIHVPSVLRNEFNRRFRGWRKLVGIRWVRGAVNTRAIGRNARAAFAEREGRLAYLLNAQRVTSYILKAATVPARRLCGLKARPPKFSRVQGKRCGTSRNLGVAAIRKYVREHSDRRGDADREMDFTG